jgi:hypothetical protein
VGLSKKLATAVSVASAVTGVAGYCGADEVLSAPRVQFAQPDPFPRGPFRSFPGYGSANGVQTIETGVGAVDALVVAQALAPPRPACRRPIFISRRDVVALVCWSRRRSSYIGRTIWRLCSRPAMWFGGARWPAPWVLPARVFTVVLIKWPDGA